MCAALGLKPAQLELSMGMSGDFEQAVGDTLPNSWITPLMHAKEASRALPYGHVQQVPSAVPAFATAAAKGDVPVDAQVEMGSTNVRVGSTIFGAREYPVAKQ